MGWQQWFVLSWMQFAVSSLFILLVTSLILRWISQPVEKVRLIQWMLAALVAMPFLFAFPIMPSRVFNMGSWLASSNDSASVKPRVENSMIQIGKPVGRVDERRSSDRIESSFVEFQGNASVETAEPFDQSTGFLDRDATRLPNPAGILSVDSPVIEFEYGSLAAVALATVHFLALIYFLIQYRLGMSRLRQTLLASTAPSASLRSRWNRITNGRGDNVRLYLSTKVETPLTFGWWNPIVVLPADLFAESESDLDACLAHEWAHIEGGDALVWFWMNLAQYALWYQPFYWTMRKELRICLELVADHRTVSSACDPFAYSELLLRLAKRQRKLLPDCAFTMLGRSNQLTRRIRVLLDTEIRLRSRCRKVFSVIVVMGFLLLSIFTSMFRLTTTHANEPRNRVEADGKSSESKRLITFTRMVEEKAIGKSQRFKEYVTEDGGRRWEGGETNTEMTAIFDKSGSKSIKLHNDTKVVISPVTEFGSTNHTWQNLQQLKNGREFAKELLGRKEINGKQASGFKLEQFERTYSVWTSIPDGELVQVEYVSPQNEQVTLSEFEFADSVDDALFDCAIPTGYEVQKNPPRRTPWFLVWGQSQQESVGMSLEWSRSRMDSRHLATNLDATRLYVLGANQMDIIDPANHRLLTFPMNADMVTTADLDGDRTREFVAVKGILKKEPGLWKVGPYTYQWTVSAYSESGIPKWKYSIEVDAKNESHIRGIAARDLDGDGRDEVILETRLNGLSSAQILGSDGKLMPMQEVVRELRSWDIGDLVGDSTPDFVSITRNGDLWVGDLSGKETQEIDTRFSNMSVHMSKRKSKPLPDEGNFVVFGYLPTTNPFALFNRRSRLASFDTKGNEQWSVELQARLSYVFTCPNRDWIAVRSVEGAYSGSIQVIEASTGEVIASKRYANVHVFQGVAWMKAADGEPLLVLSSDDKIEAYRIAGK